MQMSTATSDDLGLTGLSIGETKRDDSSTGSKVMNVRGMISDAIRKASEDIDRETPEVSVLRLCLLMAAKFHVYVYKRLLIFSNFVVQGRQAYIHTYIAATLLTNRHPYSFHEVTYRS